MWDVVVVGASVAGLTAARASATAGASTLLVERRPDLAVNAPPANIAFDVLWPEPAELRSAVLTRYRSVGVRGPSSVVHVRTRARFYDRAVLDARMAAAARKAGAEIRLGAGRPRLVGRVLHVDGTSVPASVLILADGPATIGRGTLPSLRDPDGLRWGSAWTVPFSHPRTDEFELSLGPHAPGGRTQLNPLGDSGVFWMFQMSGGRLASPPRAALGPHPDLRDMPLGSFHKIAGPIADPVFALPGTLAARGLMAVGGAAGQGGLELGVEAGRWAGEAAAKAALNGNVSATNLHRLYEAPWKTKREAGLRRFRRVFERFASLSGPEWDRLLGPWNGEELDLDELRSALRGGLRGRVGLLRLTKGQRERVASLLFAVRQLAVR